MAKPEWTGRTVTRIEAQLARHDDREQFRSGVRILLAGIATLVRG